MPTVFASIASLDDPQTVETAEMLLDHAAHEVHLTVVLQSDDHDHERRLRSIPGVTVTQLPMVYARGPSYARSLAQSYYGGEDWYYQCDAHTRHAEGWDETFLQWGADLPDKHVLSTYVGYLPTNALGFITPVRWEPDGVVFTTRHTIAASEIESPVPARFLGGGCVWAPGRIVTDAPYDPHLYFFGEEQSLALRLWTSGYDLFHPPASCSWSSFLYHEGSRHSERSPEWAALDRLGRARAARIFGRGPAMLGPHGLGTERTFEQWVEWSGCDPEAGTVTPDDEWRAADPGRAWVPAGSVDESGWNGTDAYLRHMQFRNANLRDAKGPLDLSHSDLTGACLDVADLRAAKFVGATLAGATLRGADLRGADLRFACVMGADFRGARIDESTRLDGVNPRQAKGLKLTTGA